MSRPAPFVRSVAAQTSVEARLTLRRGENLLAMIGIPAAALGFFGTLGVAGGRNLDTVLPSVLALALVASGLLNLGIATGFERGYGVLKRLGGSPLGRGGLIAAKVAVVGAIAVLQVVAIVALAVAIGWRPGPGASAVGVGVALVVAPDVRDVLPAIGLDLHEEARLDEHAADDVGCRERPLGVATIDEHPGERREHDERETEDGEQDGRPGRRRAERERRQRHDAEERDPKRQPRDAVRDDEDE